MNCPDESMSLLTQYEDPEADRLVTHSSAGCPEVEGSRASFLATPGVPRVRKLWSAAPRALVLLVAALTIVGVAKLWRAGPLRNAATQQAQHTATALQPGAFFDLPPGADLAQAQALPEATDAGEALVAASSAPSMTSALGPPPAFDEPPRMATDSMFPAPDQPSMAVDAVDGGAPLPAEPGGLTQPTGVEVPPGGEAVPAGVEERVVQSPVAEEPELTDVPATEAREALAAPQLAVAKLDEDTGGSRKDPLCADIHCGGSFRPDLPCQCNAGCTHFDDCCSDYEDVCAGQPLPPAPAPYYDRSKCTPRDESKCQSPRIMAHAGSSEPISCMCPPPLVPAPNTSCNECFPAEEPVSMTFYMYRAQGDDSYPIENLNLADLAGVMWYLHREVIGSTPRKFKIKRIMRYSMTIRATEDYYAKFHKHFGGFVAYDAGSAAGRSDTWEKYGFIVGCQLLDSHLFNYVPSHSLSPACHPEDSHTCTSPKWYSLPGPCPEGRYGEKTDACKLEWPGGACESAVVTGEPDCTYFPAPAGEISLDELEGIDNYDRFWVSANDKGDLLPNGNVEYDFDLDAGIGMHFWDGRHDKANCTKRMESVIKLFKAKYPELPETLPEPPCT